MPELNELIERYVALWNEPDPGTRRDAIRELWTEDGAQLLAPPREITERAIAATGLEFLVLDVRGRIRLDYQFIES
jgi:hypothetical protein